MNRIYEHKTLYYTLRDQIEQEEEKSKEIHKHTINLTYLCYYNNVLNSL